MLKQQTLEIPFTVSAKLTQSIEFRRKGQWFVVHAGIHFVLDADTHIGLIDGYHIQLSVSDYTVLSS